jgi:hypothetical protein
MIAARFLHHGERWAGKRKRAHRRRLQKLLLYIVSPYLPAVCRIALRFVTSEDVSLLRRLENTEIIRADSASGSW